MVNTDRLIYTALCISLKKQLFLIFQYQNAIKNERLAMNYVYGFNNEGVRYPR